MPDDDTFHVELDSHQDSTLTVSLAGELDMADATWVEATLATAADHHRRIVIDLSGLEFIDSTGLRSLMTLRQRAQIQSITVEFERPSQAVARAVDAAGLRATLD